MSPVNSKFQGERELLVLFFDQMGFREYPRETNLAWEWWCPSITLSSALELQTDVEKTILDGFFWSNSELLPVSCLVFYFSGGVFIYHNAAQCIGESRTSLQELVIRYPKSCSLSSDPLPVMSTASKKFMSSQWILSLKQKDPNLAVGSSNAVIFFFFFFFLRRQKERFGKEMYGGKSIWLWINRLTQIYYIYIYCITYNLLIID